MFGFTSMLQYLLNEQKPDLAAPGVAVMSLKANSNGYVPMSGTSMASPIVAGAAALPSAIFQTALTTLADQAQMFLDDPDLVPVAPDPAWVTELREGLPELPIPLRRRLVDDMGLSAEDAEEVRKLSGVDAVFGTGLLAEQLARLLQHGNG